ncbi:hypothetical protein EDC04DRAFT_2609974 [Pisolithus marmoratus]|nr:hypothetical protein EDC04DRAFT_2609974 [Pisolithus marmoratus]
MASEVPQLGNNSRLEHFSADVRDQQLLWKKVEEIGDKEQQPDIDCLEYPAETFKEVIDMNTSEVLFTAQAGGRMIGEILDKRSDVLDALARLSPLGRIGRSNELRGVVTWLASDASTFCTGSDIIVDGGYRAW